MDERLGLLAKVLKNQGDAVLSGRAKFTIQLEELLFILRYFDTDSSHDFIDLNLKSSRINIIIDFLQKSKALKVVGGNTTSCELFSLFVCKTLQYLELYNVPVEILTDIDFLKQQVRTITLNRSCSDLCNFLVSDDPSAIWQSLSRANFCFNNIHEISTPLQIITPYVKHLDLSHNDIRDFGDSLCGLKMLESLKVSFNILEDIPVIDSLVFKSLVARNNNIKMLDGFFQYSNVVNIDLRGNCLEYLEQLSPLAHLSKIEHLRLSENPLAFNQKYRIGVLRELNHQINADRFMLDSSRLTLLEYDYLRVPTSTALRAPNSASSVINNSVELPISVNESKSITGSTENSVSSLYPEAKTPSSRKAQRARFSSENSLDRTEDLSDKADSEVPNSMVERYGDNWLTFYEGREATNIVNDDNVDLERLMDILNPVVIGETSSSEEDEEGEEEEEEEQPQAEIKDEIAQSVDQDSGSKELSRQISDVYDTSLSQLSNGPIEDEELQPQKRRQTVIEHMEELMTDTAQGEGELEVDNNTLGSQHLAKLDGEDIFLSVHESIITEQDSIGQMLHTLDISCLENFIENKESSSIELHFDHVSSDRQHRIYCFGTSSEMYTFLKDIEAIWMTVRDLKSTVKELQCLNCHQVFPKTDSRHCSNCGSELIIDNTPFEVLPGSGQYLNDSGTLPRTEDKAEVVEDNKSDTTSNYSSATTHTDYSLHSVNTMFINQSNFVKADHTLELFMEVELFMRDEEILCCYLFAQYAKYGRASIVDCVLVVSNYMVYICKLNPNSEKPSLKSRHRLSQLRYLDIGLNYQTFRMEWTSKDAAYKFLIYDNNRCRTFIETLALALPDTTNINKVSTSTISAIQELVFGIDKTFELSAKGKQYRHMMKATTEKWGISDRMLMLKTYKSCFQGCDLVDMLVAEGEYNSRAEAVDICHQMLVIDVLHHVKFEEQFNDDKTLYRFSADEEDGYSTQQESIKVQDNPNRDILLYQLCYLTENRKANPISLIISDVKVFLTHEYHQWPLPRLQPPLPLHLRGQHFQVLFDIDIADITMLLKSDKTLAISTASKCFDLTFFTDQVVSEVVQLVSKLWEDMFGFPLQIC